MLFDTREEARADALATLLETTGATDHVFLEKPEGYFLSGDHYLLETTNEAGIATWDLYVVSASYEAAQQYSPYQKIGPVELSSNAIAGTLDTVQTEASKNVFGLGYDKSFKMIFESNDGTQELSIYTSVGSNVTDYRGGPRDEVHANDIIVIQEDVTDPQGTPGVDKVELDNVGTYRGFKGEDTILSREAATIYGGSGDDIIQTHSGNDVLFGNQNDDQLYSGKGFDNVDGGTGDDKIILGELGIARGGQGNDRIEIGGGEAYGGRGEDRLNADKFESTLFGGDGADSLSGSWRSASDTADGDYLYGGKSDDFVSGGSAGDYLFGGTGSDELRGWTGDDTIRGGSGNDTAKGGLDNDEILGGDGRDTLLGGRGLDTLFGGNGNDYLHTNEDDFGSDDDGGTAYGGSGRDVLDGGRTTDHLFGGKGNDTLSAGRGDDIVDGGSGNDVLDGGQNNDSLNGGDGRDVVFGGRGDDFIRGGHDDDVLTGDEGDDTFGFGNDGSTDVVTDFTSGKDVIELIAFGSLEFDDLFLSQDDSAAVISAGDAVIRLENVDAEDLDADDFIL
ncbi:hypothetical protein L0664_14350 [Octadecabacter sp. G9-8]|uniref:Calcium-binding protein n=1 Tax=Octadecabacter dasysiphoniae TaxID=2909341 RepID=A0ABS9D1S3_9RHOB|nr:calcium-binding protein [Octadecabacter dasysiphoniae]MCF2872253.1 hypothetical protein [Octadecabacter dasysiphoniae]